MDSSAPRGVYRVLIRFMDGTNELVDGNTLRVSDGLLRVVTTHGYGPDTDARTFPLVNIREYRWAE